MIEWSERDTGIMDITEAKISENITIKAIDRLEDTSKVVSIFNYRGESYVTDKLKGNRELILVGAKLHIEALEEELREAKVKIDKYIKEHREWQNTM